MDINAINPNVTIIICKVGDIEPNEIPTVRENIRNALLHGHSYDISVSEALYRRLADFEGASGVYVRRLV